MPIELIDAALFLVVFGLVYLVWKEAIYAKTELKLREEALRDMVTSCGHEHPETLEMCRFVRNRVQELRSDPHRYSGGESEAVVSLKQGLSER